MANSIASSSASTRILAIAYLGRNENGTLCHPEPPWTALHRISGPRGSQAIASSGTTGAVSTVQQAAPTLLRAMSKGGAVLRVGNLRQATARHKAAGGGVCYDRRSVSTPTRPHSRKPLVSISATALGPNSPHLRVRTQHASRQLVAHPHA